MDVSRCRSLRTCARGTEDNEGCISGRVCKWREFPTSVRRSLEEIPRNEIERKLDFGFESTRLYLSIKYRAKVASEEIFVRSFALLAAKYRSRNRNRAKRKRKKENEAKRYFSRPLTFETRPYPLFSFLLSTSQPLWFENDAIQFYRVEWIIRIILCHLSNTFLSTRNANNLAKFYFRKWRRTPWKSFFLPWKLL